MTNKVLALNDKGKMTYCSAPPEKRGMGRCNHIVHKEENQSLEEFQDECTRAMDNIGGHVFNYARENCAILRDYNMKAYQDARAILDAGNKELCIVQATATGKSSIMTRLMDDYSDEKCIFISPRDEINNQFYKHNELNAVALKGNLTVVTYQKITQAFQKGKFDEYFSDLKNSGLICADEIHHLNNNESKSNKKWKEAIDAFIDYVSKDNDETIFIGATATPGDGTALHYFCNDKSVSNIDLKDAINKNILNMPKIYATPGMDLLENNFFDLNKLMTKAKDEGKITPEYYNEKLAELMRLTNLNSSIAQQRKEKVLSEATKDIIKNDESKNQGTKILVFCNSADDTSKKADEYKELFQKLYPNKKIFSNRVISASKNKEEQEYFTEFQSETQPAKGEIKILAVMDKYSEGVHAPGLNFAIMDRKIMDAPSLYYQQVGRIMSSKTPTLVDFSENANKGYIDWEQLGKDCHKESSINISEMKNYSDKMNQLRFDIKSEISPKKYGMTKNGDIVHIGNYLKEKYTWTSTMYLNNVKRRIFEKGYTIEKSADVEPGFKLRDPKSNMGPTRREIYNKKE